MCHHILLATQLNVNQELVHTDTMHNAASYTQARPAIDEYGQVTSSSHASREQHNVTITQRNKKPSTTQVDMQTIKKLKNTQ